MRHAFRSVDSSCVHRTTARRWINCHLSRFKLLLQLEVPSGLNWTATTLFLLASTWPLITAIYQGRAIRHQRLAIEHRTRPRTTDDADPMQSIKNSLVKTYSKSSLYHVLRTRRTLSRVSDADCRSSCQWPIAMIAFPKVERFGHLNSWVYKLDIMAVFPEDPDFPTRCAPRR